MLNVKDEGGTVTTGPWPARDSFVADIAVMIDRLKAKLERLEHQSEVLKQHVSELVDNAHQSNRLHVFEESLRNSREYKLDELLRSVKDVKGRLDQIEGDRASFNGLSFRSFKAVDARLTELGAFEKRMATLDRNMKLTAALFCGSIMLLAATVIARLT